VHPAPGVARAHDRQVGGLAAQRHPREHVFAEARVAGEVHASAAEGEAGALDAQLGAVGDEGEIEVAHGLADGGDGHPAALDGEAPPHDVALGPAPTEKGLDVAAEVGGIGVGHEGRQRLQREASGAQLGLGVGHTRPQRGEGAFAPQREREVRREGARAGRARREGVAVVRGGGDRRSPLGEARQEASTELPPGVAAHERDVARGVHRRRLAASAGRVDGLRAQVAYAHAGADGATGVVGGVDVEVEAAPQAALPGPGDALHADVVGVDVEAPHPQAVDALGAE